MWTDVSQRNHVLDKVLIGANWQRYTHTHTKRGGGDAGSWWRGVVVSGVRRMNEVNARRARLVLGWVTVFGRVYHLGM